MLASAGAVVEIAELVGDDAEWGERLVIAVQGLGIAPE